MKFLKSYDRYYLAFKQNNSEHMIEKHDTIDSRQSAIMTFFCFFSVITSIYFSYKTIMYFNWIGFVGLPFFLVYAFAMIISFCFVEDKLLKSDSKMNILCNEIKDNVHENEKAILAFYLEVRNFLSL